MVLWWIGNIVLLAVVVPVVIILLLGVVSAARNVQSAATDIADMGAIMVTDLDPVMQLVQTVSMVHATTEGLVRYGAALDEIL